MNAISELKSRALADIDASESLQQLDELRVRYLGKKGEISLKMRELGRMSPEERTAAGKVLNALKDEIDAALRAKKSALADAALDARLATEWLDGAEVRRRLPLMRLDDGSWRWTAAEGQLRWLRLNARGLDVDDFAPRLSFFWNGHNNFFEEVAKFRASRRMWHTIMTERFGAHRLTVTFEPSGVASGAALAPPPASERLDRCARGVFLRARVPRFDGDATTVAKSIHGDAVPPGEADGGA